ncbi:beta-ketoacyl synthase N-terminal-like domain-containing protein [Segatella hominis]|uniref:beta-ketoacyl synthase N-terminal-like domain-containing protein n=1 Tax=Segatella hominis TaxID=2518605 RepID=UPI001C45CBDA|nr:beta-ketoacyl synthase N-terminal-like domain-containing protein [Segatella hominis]WOZ80468.1 beta-ketoacyl synthase N-terminal-like domain-containing protein [Segatella hominis]
MAYIIADNIISPLGETSEENYLSVKAGRSGIRAYEPGTCNIPEGFYASLLFEDFETLALKSAQKAIANAQLELKGKRTAFILSSTKGNIEENISLADSAQRIASQLGIDSQPIVVCNACISGLSALILGNRLIDSDLYDAAIVCGCDTPRQFILSGFQSLKALSPEPCRPFDMERMGLNLGEAAATLILSKNPIQGNSWRMGDGFIRNDAFHISTPSKTADGLYLSLQRTLESFTKEISSTCKQIDLKEHLAFINAHGTATLFNDQMESVAIGRAGLSDLPANAYKSFWGHTMGAAGILETIISMKAIDDDTILGTRGFSELGVSGKMNICAENRPTDKKGFIKMLSGFGGCNATIWAAQKPERENIALSQIEQQNREFTTTHTIRITPEEVILDQRKIWEGKEELGEQEGLEHHSLLTSLYKQMIGDYPKFYKMDGLSRLGFVASEILLNAEKGETDKERAIIFFNHSSSIASDRNYKESINDKDNYFPSPSIFVYTLPNIVTGEIAIRNHFHGETSFFILPDKDERMMEEILQASCRDAQSKSFLTGWIDYEDERHFEADLKIKKMRNYK